MSDDAEKPYDAGNQAQVRERRRATRLREREEGSAVQALLSSREGRNWMYALLEQCHIFNSSFSADPLQMAFSEGERNIGLRLMAVIMQYCPARYSEMMQEASDVRSHEPRKPSSQSVSQSADLDGNGDSA